MPVSPNNNSRKASNASKTTTTNDNESNSQHQSNTHRQRRFIAGLLTLLFLVAITYGREFSEVFTYLEEPALEQRGNINITSTTSSKSSSDDRSSTSTKRIITNTTSSASAATKEATPTKSDDSKEEDATGSIPEESKSKSESKSLVAVHVGPSPELVKGALEFVQGREKAYQEAGQHKHWKLRGNGHIYTYHNIALAAEVVAAAANGNGNDADSTAAIKMGQNKVLLRNVHPQAQPDANNCDLLTIWVRVNGPEIFAGKAQPVLVPANSATGATACHWEFHFDIQIAGDYDVDAKVLLWNGQAHREVHHVSFASDTSACPLTFASNQLPETQRLHAPQNTSLMGFKLYGPMGGCCEICRRTRHCQYWTTPPNALPEPSMMRNGCELYFGPDVAASDIPTTRVMPAIIEEQLAQLAAKKAKEEAGGRRRLRLGHGHRRLKEVWAWGSSYSNNTEVTYFLGCGWNYYFTLEFPCLSGDLDDAIYMPQHGSFTATKEDGAVALVVAQLPLCKPSDESVRGSGTSILQPGRWIREPYPEEEPYEINTELSAAFPINRFSANHPHAWHREDLNPLNKKCFEMNCRMVEEHGKWLSSPLQHETHWMGVWKNYACDYLEFTNQQLTECFQKRKIASIKSAGSSIATILKNYLEVRLDNVAMFQGEGGRKVVVNSLSWPHTLWNYNDDQVNATLMELKDKTPEEEEYWITPFFASSEREPYVQMERCLNYAKAAEEILTPKGYHMINTFDMSAGFTYDTAGQMDGLHITGPPMKAAITKVLHHMCSNDVEGSRM